MIYRWTNLAPTSILPLTLRTVGHRLEWFDCIHVPTRIPYWIVQNLPIG